METMELPSEMNFDTTMTNFYSFKNLVTRSGQLKWIWTSGHNSTAWFLFQINFLMLIINLIMSTDCREKLRGSLDGLFLIYHKAVSMEGFYKVSPEDSLHLVEALRCFLCFEKSQNASVSLMLWRMNFYGLYLSIMYYYVQHGYHRASSGPC